LFHPVFDAIKRHEINRWHVSAINLPQPFLTQIARLYLLECVVVLQDDLQSAPSEFSLFTYMEFL
jgi:hypothetical protein